MTRSKITFGQREQDAFIADLKREVSEYFTAHDVSDKANGAMVLKTILILGATFGSYAVIMLGGLTAGQMLPLAVLMGIGVAGMGFSVAHDALHGAYSARPWVNRTLGLSFDLLGASSYLWKITHNVIHHTYTNIQGIDEDLDVSPLLRLSPQSDWRPIHRFQHLYGFATYALTTLFWVFIKDFKYILKRDLGPYENKKHPPRDVITMLACKVVYYGYMLVLPLVVLPIAWWQVLIGFTVVHLTAGFLLGVVFQLAHVVEGPDYPEPDAEGRIAKPWLIHEMETTSNFARSNRILSWYVGGLNFQVEHHLFPRVCSVHYPAISPIVEAVARRHGVPYHAHRTFRAAVASHYRMLKALGRRMVPSPAQEMALDRQDSPDRQETPALA